MNWENLADTTPGEAIELQGFLSQTEEGKWALAPVRSCCNSSGKQKVLLPNNFSQEKPNTFLKVKGILTHSDQAYKLVSVTVIQREQQRLPTTTFTIVVIGFIIFWIVKSRFLKKSFLGASKPFKW